MPFCICSARALEVFVKDVAGLHLRRQLLPRPHTVSYRRQRNFATISRLRSLERAEKSGTEGDDDGFVPFVFEEKTESSVAAPKETNVFKERLVAKRGHGKELDEEWHAEIEILAPWPREETNTPRGLNAEVVDGVQEEVVEHRVRGLESSSLLDKGEGRTVDETSFQGLDARHDAEEIAAQVPLELVGQTLEPPSAPARSRVENRQERKLRRLQAGTYRQEAESRSKEKVFDNQVSSALSTIESMEDSDAGEDVGVEHVNTKQDTEKSMPKVRRRQSAAAVSAEKALVTKENAKRPKSTSSSSAMSNSTNPPAKAKKETWKVQKDALKQKFGDQGWQPRKRLSPDTLDGIRALHASNPISYTTQTLAEHFKIAPEAIRRILKSKWRPNAEEVEQRSARWEKRGERKWKAMAEQGTRPPAKWRAKGIRTPQAERKRPSRAKDDAYLAWEDGKPRGGPSLSGRIL